MGTEVAAALLKTSDETIYALVRAADATLFPESAGLPPILTIMALCFPHNHTI